MALEPTRTIEINGFADRSAMDPSYLIYPYYLRPDGKSVTPAFAVIREVDNVGIGRLVQTNSEHIIALEPRGRPNGGAAQERGRRYGPIEGCGKASEEVQEGFCRPKRNADAYRGQKPAKVTAAKKPATRSHRKSA